MPYRFRNLDGDLLYFVHRGTRRLRDRVRADRLRAGRLCLLPKSTTYRHMPDAGDSLLLVVESPQPIRLTEHEQVGRHTPIDPTMLDVPDVADYGWPKEKEYEVRIKAGGGESSIWYRNDPLKIGRLEGRPLPLPVQHREHPADHVEPHPPRAVLLGDVRGDGFVVVSFVPQIAVADLGGRGIAQLPPQYRHGRGDPQPRQRRPAAAGGPAGSASPRKASSRRHRGSPRRLSTPSANPETCADGPASASIPTGRSSRARHSRG